MGYIYPDDTIMTRPFYSNLQDTIIISNTTLGSGSKIMTDQDALIVISPKESKLEKIELYFTNISTLNSDSLRLLVKSESSWSCPVFGQANPFIMDSLTLGITRNTEVQVGWNTFVFQEPIDISSDSIFIWPDLTQQVNPRIPYALGNKAELLNLNGSLCGNISNGRSMLDYACKVTFTKLKPCLPKLELTVYDSICYRADTIIASSVINNIVNNVDFLIGDCLVLDTSFRVPPSVQMSVMFTDCN